MNFAVVMLSETDSSGGSAYGATAHWVWPRVAGAGHRHPAVAPRLAAHPGHGGQPVLPFGQERAELAAGAERPARALDEHLEALARQRRREQERRASPAVRRADQHHRERPVMPGGPVVIAEQGNAVGHGHRHIAPHHVGRCGGGRPSARSTAR